MQCRAIFISNIKRKQRRTDAPSSSRLLLARLCAAKKEERRLHPPTTAHSAVLGYYYMSQVIGAWIFIKFRLLRHTRSNEETSRNAAAAAGCWWSGNLVRREMHIRHPSIHPAHSAALNKRSTKAASVDANANDIKWKREEEAISNRSTPPPSTYTFDYPRLKIPVWATAGRVIRQFLRIS